MTAGKHRDCVTYRSLWTVNLSIGAVLVSFFMGTLISFKGTTERSIDSHKEATYKLADTYGDFFNKRIDEIEEDIDILQAVIMSGGEIGEEIEEVTDSLCVEIPDQNITVGRIDTRE